MLKLDKFLTILLNLQHILVSDLSRKFTHLISENNHTLSDFTIFFLSLVGSLCCIYAEKMTF